MPIKTIEITADNSIDLAAKSKILEQINKLPMDDIGRLGEISSSKKALTALKSKWFMLKQMFT